MRGLHFLLVLLPLCCACNSGGPSGSRPPAGPTFYTITVSPNATKGAAIMSTQPTDINASGEIVGTVGYDADAGLNLTGFFESPEGSVTTVPVPTSSWGQGQGTECLGINASGTAACIDLEGMGSASSSEYPNHPSSTFTQTSHGRPKLISIPGNNVLSSTINDPGDVAGTDADVTAGVAHGFLLTRAGAFTSFDLPASCNFSAAYVFTVARITDKDEIIGTFSDANAVSHGFTRSADGTIRQIDPPGALAQANHGTSLNDINSGGTIVGSVYTSSGDQSFSLASDGSFTVFNPPGTGPSGSSANGINTAGVIVGTYTDTNSVQHGYIRNLDGTFTVLDDPNAGQSPGTGTSAGRINDTDQIIGTYTTGKGTLANGFVRK
jgi:hypothetical protein